MIVLARSQSMRFKTRFIRKRELGMIELTVTGCLTKFFRNIHLCALISAKFFYKKQSDHWATIQLTIKSALTDCAVKPHRSFLRCKAIARKSLVNRGFDDLPVVVGGGRHREQHGGD
jgi:hypothetical protein